VKALVRRPGPRLGEGIVTHVERRPVDVPRAREQWHAYVRALEDAGWETVEAPPADDAPDGAFVEDTLVVFGDLAVVTRPGVEARRGEPSSATRSRRFASPERSRAATCSRSARRSTSG
jgi:dimethylargininase